MSKDVRPLNSISIIVPAYKAEAFIVPSLVEIDKVVRELSKTYELICVVDGVVDDTLKLAKSLAEINPHIRVLGYQKNRGKGYAVRFGMEKARGEVVGFIDAGLEIDPTSLKELIDIFKDKRADIVVGSKRHPKSKVEYPAFRHLISNIYYLFVKLLFSPGVSDTQAGVKIFKKKVLDGIIPKLQIDGFAFDIEMLVQAKVSGFGKVYEAPIKVSMVNSDKSSTINSWTKLLTASLRMFYDTALLFFRIKR